MSMEIANKLLAEAQEVEKRRQRNFSSGALSATHSPRASNLSLEEPREKLQPPPIPPSRSSNKIAARKPCLDDFNFVAVLGKGNFGKVMLAEEKSTRQLYAIKVLKKEFIIENDEVESTKSEKRVFMTANKARHPFLVGLHSCFQTETRIYFVMEYISGGDLMLHIQREQFTERRAKFYACEVLLALEYFHANNIVYRQVTLQGSVI
jgi:serine/threonine protein kinase